MTAPAPTACARCDGEGWIIIPAPWGTFTYTARCDQCTCSTCGEITDTAPECRDCFIADDAAYERRCDV